MQDPEAQWQECDADGCGMVLFDEFCQWAIRKNLDLEDDLSSTSSQAEEDVKTVIRER
jgi:hypothetical protein